jgi:Skp family chaperone for outer membrane proteins
MSRVLIAGLLAALTAAPVAAQTARSSQAPQASPAPASSQATALGGPQIQGLCLLSQQAVFANAKVGLVASQRLKQLTDQTQADIDSDRNTLQADAKTLENQKTSLKPADYEQRQKALAERLKALQDKADLRSREIEATRQKAQGRITEELRPVLAQIYSQHGCGLLIDRNTVFGGNMAGDLTAAVVQALDARITTITFDRESLAAATPQGATATR